ncbi:hypothetical protein NUSPORA_01577 [Nucleospora cyclopteri]
MFLLLQLFNIDCSFYIKEKNLDSDSASDILCEECLLERTLPERTVLYKALYSSSETEFSEYSYDSDAFEDNLNLLSDDSFNYKAMNDLTLSNELDILN